MTLEELIEEIEKMSVISHIRHCGLGWGFKVYYYEGYDGRRNIEKYHSTLRIAAEYILELLKTKGVQALGG